MAHGARVAAKARPATDRAAGGPKVRRDRGRVDRHFGGRSHGGWEARYGTCLLGAWTSCAAVADRRPEARSERYPGQRSALSSSDSSGWLAGLSHELRGESVDAHLVVLVLRPRSDRAFNYLADRVD